MANDQGGLTPAVLHVLLALQQGALHGYAIMQAVQETSGVTMGPGTIYGTLQRLAEAELVEETETSDERRRAYRLTRAGRATLRGEARRIAELAELLRARRLAPSDGAGDA